MKKTLLSLGLTACVFCLSFSRAEAAVEEQSKIGVVNFKVCAEESKIGRKEKEALEEIKKQMTKSLEEADRELVDLSKKLQDQDYLDGLSPQAEEDLKILYQEKSHEFAENQNQFYQMLSQANYKVLQNIHKQVSIAAEKIRKEKDLTAIVNQETLFAFANNLDLTNEVLSQMNKDYEQTNPPKLEAMAEKAAP